MSKPKSVRAPEHSRVHVFAEHSPCGSIQGWELLCWQLFQGEITGRWLEQPGAADPQLREAPCGCSHGPMAKQLSPGQPWAALSLRLWTRVIWPTEIQVTHSLWKPRMPFWWSMNPLWSPSFLILKNIICS